MRKKEVEKFEKIHSQLIGLYEEISTLSRKLPNDGTNKFKLKYINQILSDANSMLENKYDPFKDFKLFNEDNLPTNSDVVIIIRQYLNCMETLRSENIECEYIDNRWYWIIDGKKSKKETSPPNKLKRR